MSDTGGNSKGSGGFRGRGGKNHRWNWRGKRYSKKSEKDRPGGKKYAANDLLENVCGSTKIISNNENVGPGQTRMTDMFPTVPCPYQGWNHYFPNEEFTPTSVNFRKTNWFKEYLERHSNQFCCETMKDQRMFIVDHQELINEEMLKETWPQLKEELILSASQILASISLAMYQILIENTETLTQEDSLNSQRRKLFKIPYIRARLINFRPITPMKHLGAAFYGKLVAINATVVRASNSKPLCLNLAFQCRNCSAMMMIQQADGKYKPPVRCTAEKNNIPCTGTQFQPLRGSMKNTVVDWQTIRLQEKSSDGLEVGRIPRTVDCELTEDMVDTCSPGEIAIVIGVVKVASVSDPDRRTGTKDKNMYSFYVDAVAIHNQDRGTKAKTDPEDAMDASVPSSKGSLNLNFKDYEAIQKIHAEPNLFAFLVASLCPSIFGHEIVKAGLLLSLFGGSNPKRSNDPLTDKNHFARRSDIHVLVVGDPGLGKSQMLQACTIAAPRGVYVCGSSTTNSGLTVTLTKDSQCNGNEYSLEAGALVLGDQGICCIDEFDKMHGQHQALLEAMEQQSISLAKAGVVCSLPARTSILAAANPVGGHYNKAKTVSENIKMGPALLSRFDLVFLLLDRPSSEIDTMLTNHIMALHGGKTSGLLNPNMNTSITNTHQPDSLIGRLRLDPNIQPELLPIPLLRKYISYAREYVHPQMDDEAKQEILKFYVELRQTRFSGDSVTITHRQLESLVRMTQARARAELREFATASDARDVIEMVKTSFDDVFRNEAGILDFTRSQNGSGMSGRSQCKKLIAAVQKVADSAYKNLFNIEELKEIAVQLGIEASRFHGMIESLNNQGLLLKKGPKTFQLQVVDY